MNWFSDSYFEIGSTHKVCQDYAAHKDGFAVLSDGCSTSPNTDVGSRFICLNELLEEPLPMKALISTAGLVGVPKEALFATKLHVSVTENGEWLTPVIDGDGYLLAVSNDGQIHLTLIEYPDNMPWYPVYAEIPTGRELFVDRKPTVTALAGDLTRVNPLFLCTNQYSFLAVCSDGLGTFKTKDGVPVPALEIAKGLVDVKVRGGKFMHRRIQSLKRNAWADLHHEDDFAIAVLIGEK